MEGGLEAEVDDRTTRGCGQTGRRAGLLVSIKGPLTTPVGGGIRSLNVALRQMLDLYVCLRPVRWFKGVPSPVKAPEKVDMVIFRENTEDIYAGIEFEAGSADNKKFLELFKEAFPKQYAKIAFRTLGIGIKPVSQEGTQRRFAPPSVRAANSAKRDARAQGNIMSQEGDSVTVHECRKAFAGRHTVDQWERTKAARARKPRTKSRTGEEAAR